MLFGFSGESIRQNHVFIAQRILRQNKQYRLRSRGAQATFFQYLIFFHASISFRRCSISFAEIFRSAVNLFVHPHTTYTRSATATESELFLSIRRRKICQEHTNLQILCTHSINKIFILICIGPWSTLYIHLYSSEKLIAQKKKKQTMTIRTRKAAKTTTTS